VPDRAPRSTDGFTHAATGLGRIRAFGWRFFVSHGFHQRSRQGCHGDRENRSLCRSFPISGNANSIEINAFDETSRASTRFGGILGYWKDEAALKTASKPTFRQMELNLHKLIGLCYSSDELLADATALDSIIRQAFAS
jgi:hypothetical protein